MAYTDDELLLLASLPQMIGAAAVSASPSGILGTAWEFITSAKSQMEGVNTYPNNALVRQVVRGAEDDRDQGREWIIKVRQWTSVRMKAKEINSAEKLRALIVEDARSASALLAAKASPAEAREYKEWALSVGEKVAAAWVEGGIPGFGGEQVTTAERALIDEVRSAFGLSTEGGDQRSAKGELGSGRISGSTKAAVVARSSDGRAPLAGYKVIITAGPTYEPIGSDHYIAKRDMGDQGYMFAEAAVALGAETILVSGPVHLPLPAGAQVMPAETALQMLKICEHELPCHIALCAAQVSAWRLAKPLEDQRTNENSAWLELELIATPDIPATIAKRAIKRPMIIVEYAVETEDVVENARRKLAATGCDLIIARDLSSAAESLTSDRDTVHLITRDHIETWSRLAKREIARRLLEHLAAQLASRRDENTAGDQSALA
jgi:hypothetical protein